MVCPAVRKRNKISEIIETYPETLQEKAECSEGLSSQSDQMDCGIQQKKDIRCVVVGDIRNIRKEKNMGHKTNQKFHNLPYNKLYIMLEYKLKLYGVPLIKQEESYTSQCSPLSPEVSKKYAEASNRKERGMYVTDGVRYNADAVGTFNILWKYLSVSGKQKGMSVTGLKRARQGLALTFVFLKMPSYLRRAAIQHAWKVYHHIRQGWNCPGKKVYRFFSVKKTRCTVCWNG